MALSGSGEPTAELFMIGFSGIDLKKAAGVVGSGRSSSTDLAIGVSIPMPRPIGITSSNTAVLASDSSGFSSIVDEVARSTFLSFGIGVFEIVSWLESVTAVSLSGESVNLLGSNDHVADPGLPFRE